MPVALLLLLLLVPDLNGQRGAHDEAHQREGGVERSMPRGVPTKVMLEETFW
jgi:hypothetical protein